MIEMLIIQHTLHITLIVVFFWSIFVTIRIFALSDNKYCIRMLFELTLHSAVICLIITSIRDEADKCHNLKHQLRTTVYRQVDKVSPDLGWRLRERFAQDTNQ